MNNSQKFSYQQINFFLEFNVCFYRSQLVFEVKPKSK